MLADASPFDRFSAAAAVFLLFSAMGFISDVMAGGRQPGALLAANVIFSASIAVIYGWAALVNPLLMVIPLAVHLAYAFWFADVLPVGPEVTAEADRRTRLIVDAVGITLGLSLSYTFFLMFITRIGRRHVATQTEMALARDIHRVLVPPIHRRLGEFEFYGASAPSGEVGGDLVDLIEHGNDGWMAYVADVSGHGVASGVLMGMVKSAVRTRTRGGTTAGGLLTELDVVLDPLKSPAMFVTFAIVTCGSAGRLEFTVAGHLPILRMKLDGRVEEVTLAQLPVGLMPGTEFGQAPIACAPGETLALVTDGLVEVFNRRDEEFGLERLKAVLSAHRDQPLDRLAAELLREIRSHGAQLDDQTWLFIRRA